VFQNNHTLNYWTRNNAEQRELRAMVIQFNPLHIPTEVKMILLMLYWLQISGRLETTNSVSYEKNQQLITKGQCTLVYAIEKDDQSNLLESIKTIELMKQ
jgi:hypothetical protein